MGNSIAGFLEGGEYNNFGARADLLIWPS